MKKAHGILLHRHVGLHFLFLLIINLIMFVSLMSLFHAINIVVVKEKTTESVIVVVFLSTILEVIFKGLLFRFYYKETLETWGVIAFIIQMIIWLFVNLVVKKFSFGGFGEVLVFTIVFMIVRYLISTRIRYFTKKI